VVCPVVVDPVVVCPVVVWQARSDPWQAVALLGEARPPVAAVV